jgi:lipooligosaccharide transport system permease protein
MFPTARAFHVWRRNLECWKRFAASYFVSVLSTPIFYLLGVGYGLGRFVADIDGVPYAVFLTPGVIAFAAVNSATFETTIGSFTRMAEQNTYAAILATPCSVADIVAGDVLWAASKSLIATCFVLAVSACFGLLSSPLALGVAPVGFLAGLMFGALGMVVTAKAPSYDFFNYYFTLVFSVMFFFSGIFFPIHSLPEWAQWVAWMVPLTHAVSASRAMATATLGPAVLGDVVWMLVVTTAAFAMAERFVRRRMLV